jgi:hypothetical protein
MSLLPASAVAQSIPAGLSSDKEVEAFQRLFRAAYEGTSAVKQFIPSNSCDAMLGGFSLDTKSNDDSRVYFAVL